MSGYFLREKPSQGIHDELYARAIVLEDGGEIFAAASVDTLGVSIELFELVSKLVSEEIDLSEEKISVSATHTHSGPDLFGRYGEWDKCLFDITARKIASAIILAYRRLSDVLVKAGVGEVRGVIVNRRDPYNGVVDPKVHVVSFEGSKRIILSNYSCHAVVLGHNNLLLSADYPGALNTFVEKSLGAQSIFFNGACGDINPLTPTTDLSKVYDRSCGTFNDVEWMGRILGCEVVKLAELSKPLPSVKLCVLAEKLGLKLWKSYGIDEAEKRLMTAEEKYREALKRGVKEEIVKARYNYIAARLALYNLRRFGEGVIPAWLKIVGLARELAIVFIPSEVLTEVGLTLKCKSPFENTLVVTYSNGYFGYIPVKREYKRGWYEVSFPFTLVEPGCAEYIIDRTLEMLSELKAAYD